MRNYEINSKNQKMQIKNLNKPIHRVLLGLSILPWVVVAVFLAYDQILSSQVQVSDPSGKPSPQEVEAIALFLISTALGFILSIIVLILCIPMPLSKGMSRMSKFAAIFSGTYALTWLMFLLFGFWS
jgi:uncharacterized BrkB/YihY/UPF0761 family membrane protein